MIMVMIFIMMIISIKWIRVFSLPVFLVGCWGGGGASGLNRRATSLQIPQISIRCEDKSDPWRPDLRPYFRSLLLASWCQTPRPLFGMIAIGVILPSARGTSAIRHPRACEQYTSMWTEGGVLKVSAFNWIQTFASS